MKPRIFINIHYLEIGGAETSLIGLLQTLDPERADVDLFINEHRGEMMAYIPKWVNVLPEIAAYTMIERPVKDVVRRGYLHIAAARLWAKVRFRAYMRRKNPYAYDAIYGYVSRCVMPFLPSLKSFGEYDLAIAFLPPYGIVADKVKAKKKVCWVHTDYTRIGLNRNIELDVWRHYDNIVCVSEEVKRTFCEVFPELQSRSIVIENILSPAFVRRHVESEPRPSDMPAAENGFTLLTIGRYCAAKKLEEIPAICRLLTQKGVDVKWYIIGYGGSDEYIRRAIIDEGMEEHVILLGKRENPYPYIKACDWYVQPSRYEGKSVVVREAQILGVPVIITDYPTSSSQVKDGVDGIIVPMDVDECADAMAVALTDERLKESIVDYLAAHDYGNEAEVEKIYSLVG